MIDVSIVVPLKDEQDNIRRLADEIDRAMADVGKIWECLWIDDGSSDGSRSVLEALAAERAAHRFVGFAANAGQSAALWAGFHESRGRVIATLDADGQNDPADIPALIAALESNHVDMVNGFRRHRRDSLVRRIASRIANTFRNWTTGRTVRDVGCSTRVCRRECVMHLPRFAGMHRFLPTLVAMQGYRLAELPVNHRPRVRGTTKYTINNRLWVGLYDSFGVMWLRKRFRDYRIQVRQGGSDRIE